MIKHLDINKQVLNLLNQITDYYVESDLATGNRILNFKIPKQLEASSDLKQEEYLLTETDEYIIKEINYADYDFLEVFAKLNIEGLKSKTLPIYESIEQPLSVLLSEILIGTGWSSAINDPVTKIRTIKEVNVTAYDIIIKSMGVYGFEVEFDTINKVVKIYETRGNDKGAYVYSDLNLKKTEYQSDTYDFVTRLYAYGLDGLTFASINNGKEYVDNNTYSSKVVDTIWTDDSYTDASSLLVDATDKLAVLSKPRESFSIDVLDLVSVKPEYSILDFKLGDTVKIMDKLEETISTQRIVKITEYPITPEKNKIEFSNTKIMMIDTSKAVVDMGSVLTNTIKKVRTELQTAIDNATNLITNSENGNIITRYDVNNKPYELLIMDTDNIATATNVWRWNLNGLGYSSTGYNGIYGTAITQDGKIVADFITTGTLSAGLIKSGVLQSFDGSTWLNMQDGTFSFGNNRLNYDGTNMVLGADVTMSWNQVTNQPIIPTTPEEVGALPVGTFIPVLPNYITSTKITSTNIEAPSIIGGTITGNVITAGTITGNTINGNTINGGTINGTVINGGSITSDTIINVGTDVNIGNKLIIDGSDFSAGIEWATGSVVVPQIYIDPVSEALFLKTAGGALGGIWANGIRIDEPVVAKFA